jgi:hypothetical protein
VSFIISGEGFSMARDATRPSSNAPWTLLEEGRYRSAAEIAEAEGVTRSFVNRLLRLTLLAPDIVEAILDGKQPKAMQLEELTDAIPSEWEKQRKALLSGAA